MATTSHECLTISTSTGPFLFEWMDDRSRPPWRRKRAKPTRVLSVAQSGTFRTLSSSRSVTSVFHWSRETCAIHSNGLMASRNRKRNGIRPVVEATITRPFRDRVFARHIQEAYDRTCAVSGLQILNGGGRPEVQAAHIRPVAEQGSNSVRNGIGSCPVAWCSSSSVTTIAGVGRVGQAATAGRLTMGSSLMGAMLSSVM